MTRPAGSVVCAVAVLAVGSLGATWTRAGRPALRTYIVGVRAGVGADRAAAALGRRPGISVRRRVRSLGVLVASMTAGDARALADDPLVTFVEEDADVGAQLQELPSGLTRIGGPVRQVGRGGRQLDVDVAVVDTGVDLRNRDLNVGHGVTCLGGTCKPGGDDDHGHGTHVAGIIGALDNRIGVIGVAPGARIVPVKVLGWDKRGTVADSIAGLEWVADHSDRIEVANLSIGTMTTSQALTRAVSELVRRGVVVVVAAGNSFQDARAITPANHPDVITVSAIADFDGRRGGEARAPDGCRDESADDRSAISSNWGSVIDIAAPGVCITSLRPGGGTVTMSGTSSAAPHVSGAAALLASRTRPWDRAGVRGLRERLLRAGTRDWLDLSPDGIREPLVRVSRQETRP